jgi:photosystem II stability/assembly factor-like uncharacterized protein
MNPWGKLCLCACAFLLLSAAGVRAQTRGGWGKVEQCNAPREPAPAINYLQFFDSKRGVMAGDAGFICYTRDGGATWHRPALPGVLDSPNSPFVEEVVSGSRNVSGRRANMVYLVTEQRMLRSKDKGVTWETMRQPLPPGRLSGAHGPGLTVKYYDVTFADEEEGWVLCGVHKRVNKELKLLQSYVLYTDDGGNNWEETRLGPPGLLMVRMYFADKDRGWTVGEKGTILHTEDAGEHWEPQHYTLPESMKVDPMPKLLDVHFKGKERGVIVGKLGTVLRTVDGGRIWFYIQGKPERRDLIRVQIIDDNHGFAIGQAGAIFSTEDGGQSWREQKSPTEANLYAVSMQDRKHGWAAGDKRTVLRYDADDEDPDARQDDDREATPGPKKGSRTRKGRHE